MSNVLLIIAVVATLTLVSFVGIQIDRNACAERAGVLGSNHYYSWTAGCVLLHKKE